MADLYDRLDEIQDVTRVLTTDVEFLRVKLGERSIQAETTEEEEANRRFYVRAVAALIEAVVEQHKRLLLDLAERNSIALPMGVREALSERVYAVRDNGSVKERGLYLQLEQKLRAVYRAAGEAFGQSLDVKFDGGGWASFQATIKIRDRITHPKSFLDCIVKGEALDRVDEGNSWFRDLNNEFVRVARAHREQHRW